ncbi:MAG TPA: hypothetical protein VMM14_06390 [Acidimicrobiia bacterium]|nr:hypothetical protein [Acidimicrobiia bacterium]
MAKSAEPPGCRDAAIATVILVGLGLVFMTIGLSLVNGSSCDADCQTFALTLLYAGLPVSAVFGVFFGHLVVAWPLDVTFWVVVAFFVARLADGRDRSVMGAVVVTVVIALGYGLVLSTLVEIAM